MLKRRFYSLQRTHIYKISIDQTVIYTHWDINNSMEKLFKAG
jgi:hypothetical protein